MYQSSHQRVCVQKPPRSDNVQGGKSDVAPVGFGIRDGHQQPLFPGQPLHLSPEQTRLYQRFPSHFTHCYHGARQHGYALLFSISHKLETKVHADEMLLNMFVFTFPQLTCKCNLHVNVTIGVKHAFHCCVCLCVFQVSSRWCLPQ